MSIEVGGEGPKNARIVFIGEAPGDQEIREGRPFVGPAGRLFDSMLLGAGIDRRECWITNVIKEKAPKITNKANVKLFFPTRTKPNARGALYIEKLKRELDDLPNKHIIVPLGHYALFALTGQAGIRQKRGMLLDTPFGKAIPSIHPSAALQGDWRQSYVIRHDFKKIKRESEFPQIRTRKRNLLIDPDIMTVLDVLNRFHQSEYLAVDFETEVIETKPKKIYGDIPIRISFSDSPDFAITIPFMDERGDFTYPPHSNALIWRAIESLANNPNIKWIVQNAMFDCYIFAKKFGIILRNFWMDTMIAHKVLYPEMDKSLEHLVSLYLTEEPYKKGIDSGAVMNAKDSVYTFELAHIFEQFFIKHPEKRKTLEFSQSLIHPLLCMALKGVKCDIDARAKVKVALQAEIDALKFKFANMAGPDVSPTSTQQVQKYFYDTLGVRRRFSKDGASTADEDALLSIAKEGYFEVVNTILGIRKKSKLMSTYVDMKLSHDYRFHSTYNIAGTETGRLSSSKLINMGGNLQTIPVPYKKDSTYNIRDFFVADEGFTLVEFDLAQAEARIVAALADEPFMKKIFKDGGDIHAEMAAQLFNKPIEAITKSERYTTKRLVHAFNYGTGVRTMRDAFLKDGHDISEKQIKSMFAQINLNFPNIERWKARIRAKLQTTREFITPLGRRSLFMEQYGDKLFREAYGYVPQSTIGDLLNKIMYKVYMDIFIRTHALGKHIYLLLQVHDSFVYEVLDEHVDASIKAIIPAFDYPIQINGDTLIIPCDCSTGKSWGSMEEYIV